MKPEQFTSELAKRQSALKNYINNEFPNRAGRITVRFINGNFRAQGWQGATYQKWKPNKRRGTILIKTGTGRRGTGFTTAPAQARVFNDVKYMAVHNTGFNGTVRIPAHNRRILGRKKVGRGVFTLKTKRERTKTVATVKTITTVKEHTRKMNIPKRKFFPTSMHDSPVLSNALKRELSRSLNKIFE